MLLVFIFYQTTDDARQLLRHLDPNLGKPIRTTCMRSYDDSCEWTGRDIYARLDHFYVQDLAGWFFITLIVRDTYALYFSSFLIQVFGKIFPVILFDFYLTSSGHVSTVFSKSAGGNASSWIRYALILLALY